MRDLRTRTWSRRTKALVLIGLMYVAAGVLAIAIYTTR